MADRFNTAAGWALFSGIVGLGLASLSSHYFRADKENRPEKMGFEIAGVAKAGGAAEEPIEALLAKGDVDASFKVEGGALLPVRIKLALRTRGKWNPPQPLTFRPGDSQWEAAKRLFRVHYFLHGEIYSHIAAAHLQMEQYAIAVFRNLRQNPVRALLGPHRPDAAKNSPYECGFEAFEDARMKFDVRYYLVAILLDRKSVV